MIGQLSGTGCNLLKMASTKELAILIYLSSRRALDRAPSPSTGGQHATLCTVLVSVALAPSSDRSDQTKPEAEAFQSVHLRNLQGRQYDNQEQVSSDEKKSQNTRATRCERRMGKKEG